MYLIKIAEFSYLICRSFHFYIEDRDYLNFMGSCSHENCEQNSNLNGRARFLLEQTSQRSTTLRSWLVRVRKKYIYIQEASLLSD